MLGVEFGYGILHDIPEKCMSSIGKYESKLKFNPDFNLFDMSEILKDENLILSTKFTDENEEKYIETENVEISNELVQIEIEENNEIPNEPILKDEIEISSNIEENITNE